MQRIFCHDPCAQNAPKHLPSKEPESANDARAYDARRRIHWNVISISARNYSKTNTISMHTWENMQATNRCIDAYIVRNPMKYAAVEYHKESHLDGLLVYWTGNLYRFEFHSIRGFDKFSPHLMAFWRIVFDSVRSCLFLYLFFTFFLSPSEERERFLHQMLFEW